jgi:hypothetical protein
MSRRLASLFLLLGMLAGGGYATPARASHKLQVEICIASRQTAEVRIERRAKVVFAAEQPATLPAETPIPRTPPEKALYQRPPPAAL